MFKSIFNSISNAIGLKESKAITLSFEEARSRITEAEYRRLYDAFKRIVVLDSHMSKAAFIREVLGELFPPEISESLYVTCGGNTKGITFKDLVSSLVVLTKGTTDEKVRYIYSLYCGDNVVISKDEFMRFLQYVENCPLPENLGKLFVTGSTADYDQFSRWMLENRSATSLSCWLLEEICCSPSGEPRNHTFALTDDHETPTFYQTLAGVTHLEEEDIIELEERYWKLHSRSQTGKMDIGTLLPLVCPPLPETIIKGFVDAFDENRDGHIDFKEMACGISAAARGPLIERQKFCFKIFDGDKDGFLSKEELNRMVQVMKFVMEENLPPNVKEDIVCILSKSDDIIVEEILQSTCPQGMNLEEYLVWSLSHPLPEKFLTLLYQICQVVLGLRPLDPAEEYEVVTSWLARENKRGIQPGQMWYLISIDWWSIWTHYACPSTSFMMSHSDSGMGSIGGSIGSHHNSINSITDNPASYGVSEAHTSSTNSLNGPMAALNTNNDKTNGKTSRNCWSSKNKSTVEASVATDNSQNVVVTAISSLDVETELEMRPTNGNASLNRHTKANASSLSLATLDSSSSSPSPVNSPISSRKQLHGNPLNGPTSVIRKKRRPGAIDNTCLVTTVPIHLQKIPSLTGEGGRLKEGLEEGRDFQAVPQALWNALFQWYGASVALPRQVIEDEKMLRLEIYPINFFLYRHQTPTANKINTVDSGAPWTGMAGMYGAAALSSSIAYPNISPPKRVLAFTASFSKKTTLGQVSNFLCQKLRLSPKDTRLDLLWEDLSFVMVLEEEEQTLKEASILDNSNILMETRNKDQTWPEEIGSFGNDQQRLQRAMSIVSVEKGLTGLNNLGNTCFMNSPIQCMSNTKPLTRYFIRKMHMYELNRVNPIGSKGYVAKRYGDLINDMWSGTTKTIAPFKLRWTIGNLQRRFRNFQQNDAQELLEFLLDSLHEDLNRVMEKPYTELRESDNRPDVVCAQEAWENHLLRNKSIIVDLFHGQLKSCVTCKECNHQSVVFDACLFLALPLPMESYLLVDVIVIRQDGSTPVRYGLLLLSDESIADLKAKLSLLTNPVIPADNILLTEMRAARVNQLFSDHQKVRVLMTTRPIYAYQIVDAWENGSISKPETDQQIQKILTSSKNQSNPGSLRVGESGSAGGHSRQSSFSSCDGGSLQLSLGDNINSQRASCDNVVIVAHRKVIRQDIYILAHQKTKHILFGLPIVIPFVEGMTHLDLYKSVWAVVGRFLSPLPPTEGNNNHAQDCDDSLGYEFPFMLSLVVKDREYMCGRCPWFHFCRGCPISCTDTLPLQKLNPNKVSVAMDWDPTALHLRYQTNQELYHIEDPSLSAAIKKHTESVALYSCLTAFTTEEHLGEKERYNCSKCKTFQLASKKLQIWRLPPILVVTLKRFQAQRGVWIKSNKSVDFPFEHFDPTPFLAEVPRRTIELALQGQRELSPDEPKENIPLYPLQDFHQHRLVNGVDPFKLDYRLFGIICHSGIIGGGHYISYAKGANGKWYCFNDSSCKEVQEEHIDKSSAYILFYERHGLDPDAYMPRIDPRATPVVSDEELEAEENELKKSCSTI